MGGSEKRTKTKSTSEGRRSRKLSVTRIEGIIEKQDQSILSLGMNMAAY